MCVFPIITVRLFFIKCSDQHRYFIGSWDTNLEPTPEGKENNLGGGAGNFGEGRSQRRDDLSVVRNRVSGENPSTMVLALIYF